MIYRWLSGWFMADQWLIIWLINGWAHWADHWVIELRQFFHEKQHVGTDGDNGDNVTMDFEWHIFTYFSNHNFPHWPLVNHLHSFPVTSLAGDVTNGFLRGDKWRYGGSQLHPSYIIWNILIRLWDMIWYDMIWYDMESTWGMLLLWRYDSWWIHGSKKWRSMVSSRCNQVIKHGWEIHDFDMAGHQRYGWFRTVISSGQIIIIH